MLRTAQWIILLGATVAVAILIWQKPIAQQLVFLDAQPAAVGVTTEDKPLDGMIYTMYHPIASDSGNTTVEGGELDMNGKRIVTASDIYRARELGDTDAGNINTPITLAGDKSHADELYFIPKLTYSSIDSNGNPQTYTLTNFYGRVTDTGSAFRGRTEKIDIATTHARSQSVANQEDRLPNNTGTVQLIPANDKARRFATGQGTQDAAVVTVPNQDSQTPSSGSSFSGSSGPGFMWVTAPLCFKLTGPAGPSKVPFAPSCNGGFATPPGVPPVPVLDCGPRGILCTIPTGCLNLICAANANAIYDSASKTCGCG